MCEIFATSQDYYDFVFNTCRKCEKYRFANDCSTEMRLEKSYWKAGKFPTDKIHRKGDDWICDDYEPILKDSFKINEDMMKQPVKGGWVKNIFKHK